MSSINAESHKDPAQLEREVDQSRAHMSETLHALEERLSPTHLLEQALTYARQNSGEFSQNLVDTIKRNPVPSLLTAVGLSWMMFGQQSRHSHASAGYNSGYTGAYGGMSSGTASTGNGISDDTPITDRSNSSKNDLSSSAAGAKAKMEHGAEHLKHQAQHAADSLRHQGERARASFTQLLEQQPLALGALGVALGALLGGALPSTQQEDKLMGKTRDKVVEKSTTRVKETYDKTRSFGHELADDARRSSQSKDERSPYGPQ
jgi:hypothetical protein